MKKSRLPFLPNRILALLLAALLTLPASGLPVSAAECTDQPEALSFSFLNAGNNANISAVCYYSDEYFYTPGTLPDSHLRTMSLAMAMAAFGSYREGEDYTGRSENFEDLMSRAGFSDITHNQAYDEKPAEDSLGVAIASKKIRVNGTEYTLLAIGIRGAGYGAEWASNLRIGEAGQAKGFSSAKDQLLEYLTQYETEHGITDHAKIWLAGFSRAGAVSNLAGEALNEDPAAYATTTDDIYCYTFEAPQCEEKEAAGQYPNIHNTVSPADPVPLIPLSEWGMTRAGYTQEGQEDPYSQDDLLLPAPGSETYEAKKEQFLARLLEINPEILYVIDDFSAFKFELFVDESERVTQSDFIRDLVSWIGQTLPEQDRASYSEQYQEAFATFGRIFGGYGSAGSAQVAAAFQKAVRDPSFYAHVAAAVFVIQIRATLQPEEYERTLKEYTDKIAMDLIGHIQEQGLLLSAEDQEDFIEAVYPVVLFTDAALEDDIQRHGGYYLGTLLSNLSPLVQAHTPEIILAWLQTYDSYYTPELFTPHQLERSEERAATCTTDGHAEYWKCSACGILYADPEGTQKIEYESILYPAFGHHWDSGVITKEATTSTNGIRTFTCLNCGRTHTETIEKLPAPTKEPEVTETESSMDQPAALPDSALSSSEAEEGEVVSASSGMRANRILPFALIVIAIVAALSIFIRFRKKQKL